MLPTLHEHMQALRTGRVTALDLTEAALERAQDPAGEGGRVFTRLYPQAARAQARAADALRAAGIERSPIDGLPISIKDLFDVRGQTTMAGSIAREGEPPATADSDVVCRLVAAGAVIVGKTNMSEFAYSGLGLNPHYGTPRNPWDRATGRIPGGSSSGAAVSVTDGMALAAIGSDTGGSVRIPAALCGLAGFKPSAWRVSMAGALPLSTSLDSIGPLASSVACCATLDAVLADDTALPADALPLRGLRLALPTAIVLDDVDDTVAQAFDAALSTLSAAGALIERIDVPEFAQLAQINAKGGFTASEAYAWHRSLLARKGDRYDPRVIARILRGKDMTAADYIDLLSARQIWVAGVDARIAHYDALVLPTVPQVAPAIAPLEASNEAFTRMNLTMLRNCTLINFLDGCALSLPCQAPGEAPVGLMIASSNGNDRRVLFIGLAIEAALAAARG
ncbi:amidase [Bordetella holmesii]|uniref:Amidase n=2 Tax=Bordetella holmesii TaxID=35814 RepID=A0A158MAE3_9BORD|nr:amidase [Bordetella holmesii]AHV91527.1 amidase family protein [Bordetella holmesii ATCC 51541]AIT26217.1 amidase family protein [Bordetella holmesii 44057]EWM46789.1 amidase family protein [Bordetella holmesii 35009]AMD45275.1 amidase [Bordetella holmesii H558]AMD49295.1 amidase [Bordetella holmesii F627]